MKQQWEESVLVQTKPVKVDEYFVSTMVLFVTKEMFRLVHISKRRAVLAFPPSCKERSHFCFTLKVAKFNQLNGNNHL